MISIELHISFECIPNERLLHQCDIHLMRHKIVYCMMKGLYMYTRLDCFRYFWKLYFVKGLGADKIKYQLNFTLHTFPNRTFHRKIHFLFSPSSDENPFISEKNVARHRVDIYYQKVKEKKSSEIEISRKFHFLCDLSKLYSR